jgi:hypothetical protein
MTDRIDRAMRRVHDRDLSNTTIEVFEPSETYTAGEGFSVTYPASPDATYTARVSSVSRSPQRDDGGTTAEADAVVTVRDDTGQTWTDFTDELEAPVELVDQADGTRFEVEAVTDPHNGLLELEVAEV